jgi:hypothetical protein
LKKKNPGAGDTALITRPVTMDISLKLGNSPADTISTITGATLEIKRTTASEYGALTIGAGVTWIMRESVKLTSGTSSNTVHRASLTFGAGSTLVFDASQAVTPSSTVYRIYANAAGTYPSLLINGISNSHVTVRGKPTDCATCANSLFYDSQGQNSTVKMDFAYVDFYDLGCATCNAGNFKAAIEICQYFADADAAVFRMQHVTMTRTAGTFRSGSFNVNIGSGILHWNDVKTYSSLVPGALGFRVGVAKTTGTWRIEQSYFDTGFNAAQVDFRDFVLNYVVFDGQPTNGAGSPSDAAACSNVMVRHIGTGAPTAPCGNQNNAYYYYQQGSQANNPQGFRLPGAGTITASNVIYEYGDARNGEGTAFLQYTAATNVIYDHVLILPTAQNKAVPSGDFNTAGPTYGYQAFKNITALLSASGCMAGGAYYGEQNAGQAGNVPYFKNGLFVALGAAGGFPACAFTTNRTTAVLNHFTPAGIHHNNVYGGGTATQWVAGYGTCGASDCSSLGTSYDIPTSGTVPGANDKAVDPKFVWQVRGETAPGIREWALAKHGVAYPGGSMAASNDASAAFALFGTLPIQATMDEAFAYVRGRWTPTNLALKAAADDGGDIGAVAWVSAASGNAMFPLIWTGW